MKNLLAAEVFCAFFAVTYTASSSSKKPKLTTENEAASSSNLGKEHYYSCLVYFVDKDIFDDIYIANGALVHMDRVLTTRNFLEPYELSINHRHLYVYPEEWRTEVQIGKVTKIYIDFRGGSQLAVAELQKPIEYNKLISFCVPSLQYSKHISRSQITISGWRFTNHFRGSKIFKINAVSVLYHRECTSDRLKQEKYQRFSYAIATSNGEYKDRNSIMNLGDEGAPVTSSPDSLELLGIASYSKQVYITFPSSKKFLSRAGVYWIQHKF